MTQNNAKKDKALLETTGIRQSRRQTIFTPWLHGAVIDRAGDGDVTPNSLKTHLHAALPASADADATAPAVASSASSAEGDGVRNPAGDSVGTLGDDRNCYTCKNDYRDVHFFYDALCPPCAKLNWNKRNPTGDLSGRVALVTGARVKIGFHAALLLLRAGAHVIVTTRFPRDAATRYAAEKDFTEWSTRLEIFGLDLRHTPSVETFARFLCSHLSHLDFIINNACQTVRRPVGFYDHLVATERTAVQQLGAAEEGLVSSYERMRSGNQQALASSGALVNAAQAVGLNDPCIAIATGTARRGPRPQHAPFPQRAARCGSSTSRLA